MQERAQYDALKEGGTGRAADRQTALDFGAQEFIDLDTESLEADRAQLIEIVQRVRDGRVRTVIGDVPSLDDAVAAFNRTERAKGKTIVRVRR